VNGTTVVAVGADPRGGPASAHLRGALLRPLVLACDGRGARVALVATSALLLDGDHVRIEVSLGPGAWLDVVEPSGTVAYDMRGGRARWDVDVRLGADARLRWHGEPFVVARGGRVDRSTTVTMGPGARCCLRETLVLGRAGEGPGQVASRTRVSQAEVPVLLEDLLLGEVSAVPGILGQHRVVDTLSLLGARAHQHAVPPGAVRLDLERPGTVLRSLVGELHESEVPKAWEAWSAAVGAPME
jgi:urease accessory protein